MSDYPKCPWCGTELEEDYSRPNVYRCPTCDDLFYYEEGFEAIHYEPISKDDYELADFCRGGDLSERG